MRHVARHFNTRLDARVNERMRIARDLHDTLLQSFQGVLLRFKTSTDLLPNRATEATQVLGSAIDEAAEAITEGRERCSSYVDDGDQRSRRRHPNGWRRARRR